MTSYERMSGIFWAVDEITSSGVNPNHCSGPKQFYKFTCSSIFIWSIGDNSIILFRALSDRWTTRLHEIFVLKNQIRNNLIKICVLFLVGYSSLISNPRAQLVKIDHVISVYLLLTSAIVSWLLANLFVTSFVCIWLWTLIHLTSKTKFSEYWKNKITLSSPEILSPKSQITRIWRGFENSQFYSVYMGATLEYPETVVNIILRICF